MRFFLLVTALAQAVFGGDVGVRTSNLLSPADVTYVDGSYHAGLAAGPLAYSAASVPQAVYQAAGGIAAAPAVALGPQPVVQAYGAAPPAKYAAIPTVQHVQGVADVPVTRIDAQPAVIQKTVDVARPAVKTQRYEVRRPAIQKQFYDIEERVVVRPAGSAVVELEEPLSRTQKGPSVIQPTGEGVAVSSSAVAVPAAPSVSPAPAELPSVEINLARTSLPAPAPVQPVGIARTSYAPAPAPVPSVGITRASFAPAPASAPSVEVRTALPPSAPGPVPSVAFARTAPAAPAPGPLPSVELRTSYPAPVQHVAYSAQVQPVGIPAVPVKTVSVSAPIQTAAISGVSAVSSGVSGIASVSPAPAQVSISTPAPQYQTQIIQSTPAPQLSDDSVSIDSADFALARSNAFSRSSPGPHSYAPVPQPPAPQTLFRAELPPHQPPAPRSSLLVNYPNPIHLIPQSRFAPSPIYSEGNNVQSHINHENQQKLIQLLTARGGVSEIGFARSGPATYPQDAGQVRARVLSATPAPAYAAPAGERVNTRRVVVSRPIETLQEVEVAEPVTKYERHRVDQPAVVKTATQDLVRVPASVPVYGKTLAAIADSPVGPVAPVAAYHPDWQ